MEKFDFKQLDLAKELDQKKYDEELSKLKDWEKPSVVEDAMFEAHKEEWSRQTKAWSKNSEMQIEIQKLAGQIENQQGRIEKEILEKVQDIYGDHFATHSTERIDNLASAMQNGIFSIDYRRNFHSKKIKDKLPISVDFTNFREATLHDQGTERVSTLSVAHLLQVIDRIETDGFTTDVIPFEIFVHKDKNFSRFSDRQTQEIVSDSQEVLIDEICKLYNASDLKIINTSFVYSNRGSITGNLKINKKIEIPKDELVKNLLFYIDRIVGSIWPPHQEDFSYIEEICNRFMREKLTKRIVGRYPESLKQEEGEASGKIVGNFMDEYDKLDKNKLKRELLGYCYKAGGYSSGMRLLIDINNIDEIDMGQRISNNIFIDGSEDHIESGSMFTENLNYFDHVAELPIKNRIKTKAICGVLMPEKDSFCVADELKLLVKLINLDKIKILNKSESDLVKSIQNDQDFDKKELVLFISRVCNFNFFNENLSKQNLIKALANLGKLPVYDNDGDLVWPKKIIHGEVKKFVEERRGKALDAGR